MLRFMKCYIVRLQLSVRDHLHIIVVLNVSMHCIKAALQKGVLGCHSKYVLACVTGKCECEWVPNFKVWD